MTNATRVKELNISRGVIEGQITIFSKFLSAYKADDSPSVFKLTGQLDKFKNSFAGFEAIQTEIEHSASTQDELDKAINERFAIQEEFFTALAEAEELMDAVKPQPTTSNAIPDGDTDTARSSQTTTRRRVK